MVGIYKLASRLGQIQRECSFYLFIFFFFPFRKLNFKLPSAFRQGETQPNGRTYNKHQDKKNFSHLLFRRIFRVNFPSFLRKYILLILKYWKTLSSP